MEFQNLKWLDWIIVALQIAANPVFVFFSKKNKFPNQIRFARSCWDVWIGLAGTCTFLAPSVIDCVQIFFSIPHYYHWTDLPTSTDCSLDATWVRSFRYALTDGTVLSTPIIYRTGSLARLCVYFFPIPLGSYWKFLFVQLTTLVRCPQIPWGINI